MANVYKNIQATITSSASDDPMYTSPDATTSIVKTIKLYNTHGSNLVVEAGDILKMQTPTTGVINMTAAVLQITRPSEVTIT